MSKCRAGVAAFSAVMPILAGAAISGGASIVAEQYRTVDAEATIDGAQLVDLSQTSTRSGLFDARVDRQVDGGGWTIFTGASQFSELRPTLVRGSGGVDASGRQELTAIGTAHLLASSIFDLTFEVLEATPYEFSLTMVVEDPLSQPGFTLGSATLYGPDGYVTGMDVQSGTREFSSSGMLTPGEYRFQGGALAEISLGFETFDDAAHVDYDFALSVPEPCTLLYLALGLSVLSHRRRGSSEQKPVAPADSVRAGAVDWPSREVGSTVPSPYRCEERSADSGAELAVIPCALVFTHVPSRPLVSVVE